MASLQFEVLGAQHDRASFDCGVESLNGYLQRYARQNAKRDYGVTFVGVFEANPKQIAAYYTLANSKLEATRWPDELKKPPLDAPTVLLARLAVALPFQGQRVGEACLLDVFRCVLLIAETSGVAALEVDALDERATRFYARFGFQPLRESALHLFLPTARIRQHLTAS